MPHILLAGTGDAARHHARALLALRDAHDLSWSLVARTPERAAAFLQPLTPDLHPVAVYPTLEAGLTPGPGERPDMVILATPDGLHAAQIVACAAAGAHVLCEKPLALTGADARLAVDACAAAGVRLQVGYQLRYHAAHQHMHAHLHRVGRLVRMEARWDWPDPAVDGWRARRSPGLAADWAMAALGTHCLDLLAWYGDLPARPPPLLRSLRHDSADGTDLTADLLMSFPAPAAPAAPSATPSRPLPPFPLTAHLSTSVGWRSASRLSLLGTDGEWEATGTLGARGAGTLRWRDPRGAEETIPLPPSAPYIDQLRAFLTVPLPPLTPALTDAVWNTTLLDALRP